MDQDQTAQDDSGDDEEHDGDDDDDAKEEDQEEDEEEEVEDEGEVEDESSVEDGGDSVERNPHELLVELSAEPVRVPAQSVFHRDWDAFKEYLADYSAKTHQVIAVFEVMKAEERNRRLARLKKTAPADVIPINLSPYSRVYKCTHGPKPKDRGKGMRPGRFIRYTRCPFRFRVQWVRTSTGKWMLKVTPTVLFHNHTVGEDSYGTYPVARGIQDPAAIARAKEMVTDGVRRAVIYDRMLDLGQNVFKSDIDNFVSAHQARASHRDEDVALAQAMPTFVKENPDGVLTVDETERGETGVISVMTLHIRNMFARFGELMLVDCAHKINRFNYQLCTLMVMDEYGTGQVVQQSLLETNGDWHMERAILHLKHANPDSWKLVRVIVVDKDLNEVRVLKRLFQDEVRILLCHFHVVKYLQLAAHKPEFGKLTKADYSTIDHLCHNLVYSRTKTDFADNKVAFLLSCQRLSFAAFSDYVNDNWFACPEMWVMFMRSELPHFRNHTNNRLESWFGKFKEGVDENSSLADCFQALLSSSRRCEEDYMLATMRVERFYNANYDEEMEGVLLCSTPFVAEAVLPQYTAALNKVEGYTFDFAEDEHFVVVKGKSRDHVVDTLDWTRDCEFSKTMRLPCRHAMAWRKSNNHRVIPLKAVDVRWQRAATTPAPARFNEAMRVLKPICSELSDIDDPEEFRAFIEFLGQFRNLSQANSLYSAELGDVPAPRLDTLHIPKPVPLVCNDGLEQGQDSDEDEERANDAKDAT